MNGLALCAGVGGLELGLQLALPGRYRSVGYVERDAFAAAVLVARMADKALDPAPVWDDLATFDGRPWRGGVDLVSSGLPCQPYSLAGKRAGHADDRALWPHLVRIVGECEPGLVFIENVPPFLQHAEPVWRALRGLGFRFAPPLLQTASEAGAPHIRRRLFVLAAHPERQRLALGALEPDGHQRTPPERGRRDVAADGDGDGREGEWGGWVFDRERETLRHDTHRCTDRCRICGSPWAALSPLVRVAHGPADRVDRLRAIGNAVVPVVAARAFTRLARELGN
jgi:DNA (cytosine-5)-methyltransferase 1